MQRCRITCKACVPAWQDSPQASRMLVENVGCSRTKIANSVLHWAEPNKISHSASYYVYFSLPKNRYLGNDINLQHSRQLCLNTFNPTCQISWWLRQIWRAFIWISNYILKSQTSLCMYPNVMRANMYHASAWTIIWVKRTARLKRSG